MCMFCKCDTVKQSATTHVVNYKDCEECVQCGEKYYTDKVAEQLEKIVKAAKQLMQDISVIDFTKAA